jgi:hypothetical protein
VTTPNRVLTGTVVDNKGGNFIVAHHFLIFKKYNSLLVFDFLQNEEILAANSKSMKILENRKCAKLGRAKKLFLVISTILRNRIIDQLRDNGPFFANLLIFMVTQ